jgi:hypothetical protein
MIKIATEGTKLLHICESRAEQTDRMDRTDRQNRPDRDRPDRDRPDRTDHIRSGPRSKLFGKFGPRSGRSGPTKNPKKLA